MMLANGQLRFMFVAKDYDASVAFYRDGLGLQVDHDWNFGPEDCGTVFLVGAGMVEVLGGLPGQAYTAPQGPWMSIQIADPDAFYQLALERGLKVIEKPTTYPWGQRMLKLQDPDGIMIWLFAPVKAE